MCSVVGRVWLLERGCKYHTVHAAEFDQRLQSTSIVVRSESGWHYGKLDL